MDAKADLYAALAALGVPMEALSVTADAPGFYHPGRSGVVRQGPKTVLGRFGELHPAVLAALDLGEAVRVRTVPRRGRRPEAAQAARRTCPRSSRSGATSRSWSMRT